MKRAFDIILSSFGLIVAAPFLSVVMVLLWMQDRASPFYIADRVGQNGQVFRMIKLRSMVLNADRSGVDSTAADDKRITRIGALIRRYKLDEIMQLWNVLIGDMSLVGPRPNVKRETELYTSVEKALLHVKPGITDFASIVFSDEGEILRSKPDADIAYNQLVRPWKSKMGLFYIKVRSLNIDLFLIALTIISLFSKKTALKIMVRLMKKHGADLEMCQVVLRIQPLVPTPPPGSDEIISSRNF